MSLADGYRNALGGIPAPGGCGCHPALLGVANLGIMAGVMPDQVVVDIRASIPKGGRRVSDREIQAAVCKAAEECVPGGAFDCRLQAPALPRREPEPDGVKLCEQIMSHGYGDEARLVQASPICVPADPREHTTLLLRTLYQPKDFLFIGSKYDKTVRPVAEWLSLIEQAGAAWPFIIPNPLDGRQHKTSTGTMSYRCDAAVSQFRFAIAEFDNLSWEDQLRFWSGVLRLNLFDVTALIDSGGKSIHAWLCVGCPDRNSWTRDVEGELFGRWLTPLGVDRACRNESRLSRLPGHFRQEKGKWQRLLYLQKSEPQDRVTCDIVTQPRETRENRGFCHTLRKAEGNDWPAVGDETIDIGELEPCPQCGSLELWKSLTGTWRCQHCDGDMLQRSLDLADRAAKLRAGERLPPLQRRRWGRPVRASLQQAANRSDETKAKPVVQGTLFEGVLSKPTQKSRRRRR